MNRVAVSPRESWRAGVAICAAALAIFSSFSGCSGFMPEVEKTARARAESVSAAYRPAGVKPDLPALAAESSLETILQYALLNNPAIEAAYYEWISSVERITPARSLPDPRITFESDIQGMIMSLMPGLMIDVPGPGKLRAQAGVAAAESDAKYEAFRESVLRTAAEVKSAYYQLQALEDSITVNRRVLSLVKDFETIARAQHAAGKVTLQDVLRAEIERDELGTKIDNLEDSRNALRARYVAALGIAPGGKASDIPRRFANSEAMPPGDELLDIGLKVNPRLAAMQAEIRKAEASVTLARRGAIPDFGFGIEVDVKPNTPIVNPQLSITLPIWRDKIAAEIAAARADEHAARARLTREEIMLASEFAVMTFMYRESERDYRLLEGKLLPKARRSVELARAGYVGGESSFIDFLGAERALLQYELNYVDARRNREIALANISLTIAGMLPRGVAIGQWRLESGGPEKEEK